ncbi:50S ribosomal protein L1 [Gammaproteobacteria bacterium]|jgi:large subunit ribosomal protein L1|nr:50S ribosomal protein L1 [Gammaproteobacteria bacterium]MDC0089115.1 50S ribosomal protein L1 [Gammaproteobacteria bacterium]
MTITKRQKLIVEKIDTMKAYELIEALELVQSLPKVKFNESVDISINLGVDPKKSDQNVRGSSSLPHGIGKTLKVAVFAEGEDAAEAKKAGAEIVGFEDLIADVKKNKDLDADVVIATPDCMAKLGALGRILGPKNLMPNPKEGTVTKNVVDAVNNAKKGQVRYKTDKAGIIHTTIGKIDFEAQKLAENINFLIDDLIKAKPSTAKGKYMTNISISSTMGPGIKVDLATVGNEK